VNSFRTEIKIKPSINKVDYSDNLLFMGSCFSENIGEVFSSLKFNTKINPFGILFNPLSIAEAFRLAINREKVKGQELIQSNDLWCSLKHHSQFSTTNKEEVLNDVNNSISLLRESLDTSDWLFITLGSAWVYDYNHSGEVVANCHKIANSEFTKRMLPVSEVVNNFSTVLKKLKVVNPKMKVVFTVSPVRHWKDGVVENQRSKSVLHLAISELEEQFENVSYFPAYELIMDDLRDYRFYEKDMLHLNEQAVDYIWNKIEVTYLEPESVSLMHSIRKLLLATNHRPFNVASLAHQQFVKKQLKFLLKLEKETSLSFIKEKQQLENQLS
jgi:hypothetical protein